MRSILGHHSDRSLRSREKMSGQEDWQATPPPPPMQANDLPLVAQAVPPASYIFSQLLTVPALMEHWNRQSRDRGCPLGRAVANTSGFRPQTTIIACRLLRFHHRHIRQIPI